MTHSDNFQFDALLKMYDEYQLTCESIIKFIDTKDVEFLVSFVDKKGQILKNMLRQESIVVLSDDENLIKNARKAELLEYEKKALELFNSRYQKIVEELSKVKKNKKLTNAYKKYKVQNTHSVNIES
ncbi:hypothetical protein IJC60_01390 [bacterium]|nr:hypothetical protein [bacterium]